jgi:hypothetical protein
VTTVGERWQLPAVTAEAAASGRGSYGGLAAEILRYHGSNMASFFSAHVAISSFACLMVMDLSFC